MDKIKGLFKSALNFIGKPSSTKQSMFDEVYDKAMSLMGDKDKPLQIDTDIAAGKQLSFRNESDARQVAQLIEETAGLKTSVGSNGIFHTVNVYNRKAVQPSDNKSAGFYDEAVNGLQELHNNLSSG